MTEATTPDDKKHVPVAEQLENIGDEYGVHREEDEDDETYANRILETLNEMIDELVEVQGSVYALLG